ncbi:serine protease [Oerskovia sp. NPDC060287]|uniref:S1 family peptidase n=1 Tax=Oerskovia sp. NPDC060287 TaxID=3347095 RepID=UPI00366881C8
MLAETIAERLFFNPVHLDARSKSRTWTGTGFVYAVDTDKGLASFVVTNKHVLAGAERLTLRFVRANGDEPALGLGSTPTLEDFDADWWTGHPEADIDVAVMPLGRIVDLMAEKQVPIFYKSITPALTLSDDDDIDAMEAVTFIGYPNGLYDRVNLLPIARRGSTATPIRVDYGGRPTFLIDASVFPGSSGSPVFILDRGTFTGRSGDVTVGTRVIFLGVLAAVHTRIAEGTIEVLTSTPVARFAEPIDLGIVYKASCVLETVDLVLERSGLKRLPSAAPMVDGAEPSDADEQMADPDVAYP